MPLYLRQQTNDETWGVWRISESETELLELLPHASNYANAIAYIQAPFRRIEFLAVRVLCSQLIGEPFSIEYDADGRPLLSNCRRYKYLSISHTKGYAAVSLHASQPVGIDIEQRGERILRIRGKFVNDAEELAVSKTDPVIHLLLYWSAKETLFKVLGQTEVDFRKHLHLHPFVPISEGEFSAHETRTAENRPFRIFYKVDNDFVLTRTHLFVPNFP